MITDFLLGMLVSIGGAIVDALPTMPEQPAALVAANVWIYQFNYWLPVGELVSFLVVAFLPYVAAMLLLRIWRVLPVVGGR